MALSQMTVKTVSFWDLLSPKLSWEQGWRVSAVALTIKLKEKKRERETDRQTECLSWTGTNPQDDQETMATAVKMSNVTPQLLQPDAF